jgi:hypothetical protein
MAINYKKLLNNKILLWILFVILIIAIGYHFLLSSNIIEGNVLDVPIVVISPAKAYKDLGQYEWLNIDEITLYDSNNRIIPYTATSTNGIYVGSSAFSTEKLYDGLNFRPGLSWDTYNGSDPKTAWTMYHSGQPGTTLTLIPTTSGSTTSAATSPIMIKRLVIRNRNECCQDRLKFYKFEVLGPNDRGLLTKDDLINYPELYDPAKNYTVDIPIKTT